MVLVQKWPFFQLFFYSIQATKMSFTIFQKEKTPFQGIKTSSLKARKIDIFPKGLTQAFGQKNGHFSNFSVLGNKSRENVFYYILERKNAFLRYKNKKSKQSKNRHFSKGLTHGFGTKMTIFPTSFFFRQQKQGKYLYDNLERKNAFLGYKNEKLKTWKT